MSRVTYRPKEGDELTTRVHDVSFEAGVPVDLHPDREWLADKLSTNPWFMVDPVNPAPTAEEIALAAANAEEAALQSQQISGGIDDHGQHGGTHVVVEPTLPPVPRPASPIDPSPGIDGGVGGIKH